MEYVLQTERLTLRPFTMDDLDVLYETIMAHPKLPYYMTWELPKEKKETEEHLASSLERMEKGEICRWAILLDDTFIGTISLEGVTRYIRKWRVDTAELGYWLNPDFHGQGIMTEAGEAVLQFGFEKLELHKITVGHITENTASQRVVEKLGFRLIGEQKQHCFYDGRWWDNKKYELLKQDWKNR